MRQTETMGNVLIGRRSGCSGVAFILNPTEQVRKDGAVVGFGQRFQSRGFQA